MIIEDLRAPRAARRVGPDHAPLPDLLALRDAARLPRGRRLVHRLRRDPPADARRERDRRVDARLLLEADGRLAAQHGRLEHLAEALLRAAAALLSVRLRRAERDRVAGGARGARDGGLDQLQELHRPWIDEVTIACAACGKDVRRIPEVGDAWLDAGIVPFSTLGWNNPEWIEHGYATGAAEGLSGADLPDHAYWEQWFPADWISEMREQIRLWFYSISFMSMTLVGQVAVPGRAHLREAARRARARDAPLAGGTRSRPTRRSTRWARTSCAGMFCEQNPGQNIKFGYGPAHEVKRRLLTLWNSVKFFVDYANVSRARARRASSSRSTAGSLSRVEQLVAETTDAYERFWTPDVIAVVRVVRRRPVELVHPPVAAALLGRRRGGAGDASARAPDARSS